MGSPADASGVHSPGEGSGLPGGRGHPDYQELLPAYGGALPVPEVFKQSLAQLNASYKSWANSKPQEAQVPIETSEPPDGLAALMVIQPDALVFMSGTIISSPG